MSKSDQIATYYSNARELVKQKNPMATRAYVLQILNAAVESYYSASSILIKAKTGAFLDKWIAVSKDLYDKGITEYVLECFGLLVKESDNGETKKIGQQKPTEQKPVGDIDILKRVKKIIIDGVYNDIDQIAMTFITTEKAEDPYRGDSARELLKAYLIALLEDSRKSTNPITEETYSFSTIMELSAHMTAGENRGFSDDGFFSKRSHYSKAYKIVSGILINNAGVTASCILSTFYTKMAAFKDVAPRIITSANSFDMSEFIDGPTAVFIDYRDELQVHYQLISMFVQEAYRFLIGYANDKPTGKLDVPFYFILDEFGNFPRMLNFQTVISASGGRNIFFILIIQSYAQLDNVYGKDVAAIIRDNLNMHVFFGSNNPETLDMFSKECGQITRVSPLSALNGDKERIEKYEFETIASVPKSMLSHFEQGECIITEANSGYVLYSRLERCFLCDEFKNLPQDDCKKYKCPINPFDDKYTYELSQSSGSKKSIFDDFDF